MKKFIFSALAFSCLFANSFKNDMGFNIFVLDNNFIRSGSYDLKNINIDNTAHILTYHFKFNKKYQPFIIGGFGNSDFKNGSSKFDSKYLKAGLGLRYNYSNSLTFSTAFSKLWLDSDIKGSYANEYSKKAKDNISDFYIAINHKNYLTKKQILESQASIHYHKIKYDYNIKSVNGFNLNTQVALINKNITKVFDLNVSTRVFANAVFLDNKLSDSVGFNYAATVGGDLYINIAKFVPVFKEKTKDLNLDFSAQITRGDKGFKGYKIGAGFKLLKY